MEVSPGRSEIEQRAHPGGGIAQRQAEQHAPAETNGKNQHADGQDTAAEQDLPRRVARRQQLDDGVAHGEQRYGPGRQPGGAQVGPAVGRMRVSRVDGTGCGGGGFLFVQQSYHYFELPLRRLASARSMRVSQRRRVQVVAGAGLRPPPAHSVEGGRPMSGWMIVVARLADLPAAVAGSPAMTARDYIMQPRATRRTVPKILNLSRSYGYQTLGYYCSLLAEARGHKVVPTVTTVLELTRRASYVYALAELEDNLNRTIRRLADPPTASFRLLVCLGQADD